MRLTVIILAAYAYFMLKGLRNPLYFALVYIWFSFLYPQAFTSPELFALPFSAIAGGLAIAGYLFKAKRGLPRMTPIFLMVAAFCIWVTCTSTWAEFPGPAWFKWNWAVKSISLALMLPFFFRTRKEIEASLLVMFFAIFAHVGTAGIKTALGGGGYGYLATLMIGNSWLGESSTLSTVAIISIPMAYYITRDSLAAPRIRAPRFIFACWSLIAVLCMVGTAARAGLLALAAFLSLGINGVRNKIKLSFIALVVAILIFPYMPSSWISRMQKIKDYDTDSSATGRLVVWQWTINYALAHPLGGGFEVYLGNTITRYRDGETKGKAFHSIYFEVLGEHGLIGFALYLSIAGGTLLGLTRLSKDQDLRPDQLWLIPFSNAIFAGTVTLLVGGAFIGIAYQPIGYALFGLYLSLLQAKFAPLDPSLDEMEDDNPGLEAPAVLDAQLVH